MMSYSLILPCLVCETDFGIEILNNFSSTNAEYQLLSSHLQLTGREYSFWESRCSGKGSGSYELEYIQMIYVCYYSCVKINSKTKRLF